MITCMIYDHAARKHCYALLAEAFGLRATRRAEDGRAMSTDGGNLFAGVPENLPAEHFATLLLTPNVRIERIVSRGQASPEEYWYDQARAEWVMVVAGSRRICSSRARHAPRHLKAGDYIHIPAHTKHRVMWTDALRADDLARGALSLSAAKKRTPARAPGSSWLVAVVVSLAHLRRIALLG